MSTVDLYGQSVPVPILKPSHTALDIVILVRAVDIDDQGQMSDAVYYSAGPNTTFTTAIGTVQRHLWRMREIAEGNRG